MVDAAKFVLDEDHYPSITGSLFAMFFFHEESLHGTSFYTLTAKDTRFKYSCNVLVA
jgi:hypothetical protein